MRKNKPAPVTDDLKQLCVRVKTLVLDGQLDTCVELICKHMSLYPHAPEPHNLLGIVLEKMGDHVNGMKHFLAAWALDPTYEPANHNLNTFGTFFSSGRCAYDESDIPSSSKSLNFKIEYDEHGIGRVVSKTKVEYDEHGIGRVVRR